MEPPSAASRKRARPPAHQADPQLREEVLTLVRSTRAPLVAQRRRVELAYDAAWRAFCRAVAAPTRDDDDDETLSSELTTALRALAQVCQSDDPGVGWLETKIASSVAEASWCTRHKTATRQQTLLLVWTWLGHSFVVDGTRLWRLDDVLVAVAIAVAAQQQQGRGGASLTDAEHESAGSVWSDPAQHGVDNAESTGRVTCHDAAAIARAVLQSLCQSCHNAVPRPLVLVTQVIGDVLKQRASDAAVVTALRTFLRTQVRAMLVAFSRSPTPTPTTVQAHDAIDQILTTLQAGVSPADVVQLFRQAWVETKAHDRDGRDPLDALAPWISFCAQRDRVFKSQALAMAHDLAHDAMTASDAVLLRDSLELAGAATVGPAGEDGHVDDAGYTDWFKHHFAALDALSFVSTWSMASDHTRLSLSGSDTVVPSSSPHCLRAPSTPPSSSASSSTAQALCHLVSTKRHLQFVCAFLVELDRLDSPRRSAHHVLAHLSAMKTHQTISGSAVGGLLVDFCSQTRARYTEMEAQEQERSARLRRRRLSSMGSSVKTTQSSLFVFSQATPAASQYAPTVRGWVDELLELKARDPGALGSRVNQYKMFEMPKWKQVLPCCLDLEYWQGAATNLQSDSPEDTHQLELQRRKQTLEIVDLVQLFAKHHAVGTHEYMAFLERVEAWFQSVQHQPAAATRRYSSASTSGHHLTMLGDAVNESLAVSTSDDHVRDTSWRSVTSAFVIAFEGLMHERPTEQLEHMQVIYEITAQRLARDTVAASLSLDQAVNRYIALWIALLSNESDVQATPDERMHVMDAYCTLASQAVNRTPDPNAASSDENLVETALLGSLLGLLASVTVCEALARSASLAFCVSLEPTNTDPSIDDLVGHLRHASAFLAGFVTGFIQNPTESAPQLLLQSMLTPQMRECLIWAGHHTTTWWTTDDVERDVPNDWLWPFVGRAIQSAHDQHGWFRLTLSPGVFTTKDQWQVFTAMELTSCVTQLLLSNTPRVNVVDFVSRQHEQVSTLMLTSAGGLAAGVRVSDVCIWIVQTTLELSMSSPRVTPFALDTLVLLLKGVWMSRSLDATGELASPSDTLGFLMELTLQLSARESANSCQELIHYAVRCAHVFVDGTRSSVPPIVNIPSLVTRAFIEHLSSSCRATGAMVVPFAWVSVAWCIVLKLQHASDVYASATELPPSILAHWAFEFPRLCRLLTVRKNCKVSHPTNASLLRTVQTCYEFFRTLDVRRLAPAPSMALFSVASSQYVPASTADETLELHVRSLEWLVASERLSTPTIGLAITTNPSSLTFEISLAFQQTATRVLSALLEDVSIGRPDDVATELTEICQSAWLASVSVASDHTILTPRPLRLQYQLLLVHMVSELAARHAAVGRFLLRSSSELLGDSRRALFLLLVLVASKEIEQLDGVLQLNSSLWVNTFAEVACSLADIDPTETETKSETSTDEPIAPLVSLLRHSFGFESQLLDVLSRLLSFAATRQIDLLDSSVVARLEKLFPSLHELLARVPVLHLASAALADW